MIDRRARYAALLTIAALTACSGAGPAASPATAQLAPQILRVGGQVFAFGGPRHAERFGGGWMSRGTTLTSLLYGSSYDGGYINIYDEHGKNQQPIGQLTSTLVSPQGMAVDGKHRLWVANTNAFNVVAFQRGATTPFKTLNDSNYYPISVAVNSKGTVYAANAQSTTGPPGNVTVWAHGSSNPTGTLTYPNFNIVIGVGVDRNDDVFVSYVPTSGPPAMVEFPDGSQTGQLVSIQDANLGDMSFDKNDDLLMETLSNTLGVWTAPYTSGPARTINAFGNEPTLDKREGKVWIAYANFSNPMLEGYSFVKGTKVDTITSGWTNSAIPYGVALDPALR